MQDGVADRFPVELCDQWDAPSFGVHTDHRGHGLGLAIKAHNLRLCASVNPTTRVYTWNAAENTHMRDINRRLGCQVVAVSGEWERRSRT